MEEEEESGGGEGGSHTGNRTGMGLPFPAPKQRALLPFPFPRARGLRIYRLPLPEEFGFHLLTPLVLGKRNGQDEQEEGDEIQLFYCSISIVQ